MGKISQLRGKKMEYVSLLGAMLVEMRMTSTPIRATIDPVELANISRMPTTLTSDVHLFSKTERNGMFANHLEIRREREMMF
jgi:hypothetical protein